MVTKKKQVVKKRDVLTKKTKRRMLIVDIDTSPGVSTALSAEAIERSKVLTFPCKDCGAETNPSNRSILQDGRVIHIGCPKLKPREVEGVKRKLSGLPKHKGVKVPVAPVAPVSEFGDIVVMSDFQGRTCIQVKRDVATVSYLPFDATGLHVTYLPTQKFDERFRPLIDYPVVKACTHFVKYAVEYGATDDVLGYLSRVVTITEEQHMAAKKKLGATVSTGTTDKAGGKKVKQPGEGRKGSEASAFLKKSIMEGKLTDEAIFAKAKELFGLDDKKRYYVSWYRWQLKKQGQKPPEPKKDPKKEKAAPAKKETAKKPAAAKSKPKAKAAKK